MKRVFWAAIIGIAAVTAAALILETVFFLLAFFPDRSEREHLIIRLSAQSNSKGETEDYIYRYYDSLKTLRYSFETKEAAAYNLVQPKEKRIVRGEAVIGSQIYYVLTSYGTDRRFDDRLMRFDCETLQCEEILSTGDICGMCGSDNLSGDIHSSIVRTEKCLLLTVGKQFFLCPVRETVKKDWVENWTEANDLFQWEDRTGSEQEINYLGLDITRSYDVDKEKYIVEIREEKNGYAYHGQSGIIVNGKLIFFGSQRGECFYWTQENPEKKKIDCLNKPEFDYSVIQQKKVTTENGEIIGLTHVVNNFRCESWSPAQRDLKYDVLFMLNPETGENRILYQTKNNRTRIIGYRNGTIYLMNNSRIYTKDAAGGETELFLTLPENPEDADYIFDWQGDFFIVICRYEIFGVYKVR